MPGIPNFGISPIGRAACSALVLVICRGVSLKRPQVAQQPFCRGVSPKRPYARIPNVPMKTRRSVRLNGYDYRRNGLYFVTVCTNRHECLFGTVVDGEVILSAIGRIVAEEWQRTAELRENVELDAFVVMPNHIHGIIVIRNNDERAFRRDASTAAHGEPNRTLQANSLGAIIGRFKGKVSRCVHDMPKCRDLTVWQRNYFDHIIRSEKSLQAIREYVAMNPARWTEDSLYLDYSSGSLRF